MNKKQILLHEIEDLSEPCLERTLEFVRLMKTDAGKERFETALASESSLSKDWSRPEEDEAWKDL